MYWVCGFWVGVLRLGVDWNRMQWGPGLSFSISPVVSRLGGHGCSSVMGRILLGVLPAMSPLRLADGDFGGVVAFDVGVQHLDELRNDVVAAEGHL